MPTLGDLIEPQQREGLAALSSGGIGSPAQPIGDAARPSAATVIYRGRVGLAPRSDGTSLLSIVIPAELFRLFGWLGGCRVTMSEPDNFEVVPVPDASRLPRFVPSRRSSISYVLRANAAVPSNPVPDFYSTSPAEILLEGGHLLIRVLERVPFIGYPERRKPVPVVLETSPIPQAAPEIPAPVHQGGEPTPDREPAPAAVGRLELALRQSLVNTEQPRWQPSGDDIRACLAALRGIEEFTDYRLVKLKEGEHQRWVFQARID